MEMSESYAATIAAVVPVIWLIASVELHQFSKQSMEEGANFERALLARRRLLEEPPAGTSLEGLERASEQIAELERVLAQVDEETGRGIEGLNILPPVLTYWVWTVLVALLVSVEAVALYWLGSDGDSEPGMAWFCFGATVVGFLAITVMPAIVALHRLGRSIAAAKGHRTAGTAALEQRMADLRRDVGLD